MAMRQQRRRSLQLESLEVRETPGTVLEGVHALATAALVEPRRAGHQVTTTAQFQATGVATLTGQMTNSAGSTSVTAIISGTATPVGKKTTLSKSFGSFSGTIAATVGSGAATTTIQFKKGTLNVSLTSNGSVVSSQSGTGNFTITGGSGAFAHTSGSGTLMATVSLSGPAPTLSFQLMGKVSVVK
jgi:hypothetical protein